MAERTVKINILGDAKGGVAALNETGSASDGLIGKLASFGTIVGGVAVAGVAALGALGVGAFKLGATFDDAYDTIRLGTGATGEALEGLQEDFKAVVSSVPTDFDTASTAIADLNTRLGLTGEPLQEIATQMLNLANISGKEVGPLIASTTRLFGDWSIATEDQAETLDTLWKVSQTTGIGVDTLAEKVVQFGAPLRQMGFSFEESAAMIGKWEKEGVNAELVLGSLRIALGNFARDGVTDTKKALEGYIKAIQKAGSTGEANALAMEIFGAKAGPDMAAAIREGRFELDDLLKILDESPETINGAAEDVADLAESWTLLKNKAMVALEPIGNAVFGLASQLVAKLIPAMDRVSALMQVWAPRIVGFVMQVVGVFAQFGSYVGSVVTAVLGAFSRLRSGEITLAQFIGGIKTMVATILGDLFNLGGSGDLGAGNFMRKAAGFLRTAMPIVLNELYILGMAFGTWVQNVAIPWLGAHLPGWLTTLGTWISNTALPAIGGFVSSIGAAFGGWIQGTAIPYLRTNLPLWLAAISAWVTGTAAPAVGGYLYAVGTAFGDWVATRAVPWVQANFPGWLKAVTDWITNTAAPEAGRFLVAVGTAFGDWVATKAVPYLQEKLPEWLTAISTWITETAVPAITAKAGEMAAALVAWIKSEETQDKLEEYNNSVKEKLQTLWDWLINDWGPRMAAGLSDWIFFETMGEKLGRLKDDTLASLETIYNDVLPWASRMLTAFDSWLLEGIPIWTSKLIEANNALDQWQGEQLGKLGGWASKMLTEFDRWLLEGIPVWTSSLLDANNKLDAWQGDQLGKLVGWASSVGDEVQRAVDYIASLPVRVVADLGDLSGTLYNAGVALMTGFANGVADKAEAAVQKVRDAVQRIRDLLPGSEPKDPASPLRKLGEAGKAIFGNISQGMRLGLPATINTVLDTFGTLGEAIAGALGGLFGGGGSGAEITPVKGTELGDVLNTVLDWRDIGAEIKQGVDLTEVLDAFKNQQQPLAEAIKVAAGGIFERIRGGLEIIGGLHPYLEIPRTVLTEMRGENADVLTIGEQLFDQATALKETAAYYANAMREASRLFTEGQSLGNGIARLGIPNFDFAPGGGGAGAGGKGGGGDIYIQAPVYGVDHFAELVRKADQRNNRRGG